MNRKLRVMLMVGAALTFASSLFAQTEQTLYSFTGAADGQSPLGGLVMDASGNLYGTTFVGGAYGLGEVFEMSRNSNGSWTESVLYSFTGGADGGVPSYEDLIFDAAGNLYGTTTDGGASNHGTVFELTPTGSGWTEKVLYSFAGGTDGAYPYAGLVFDKAGDLYGTTYDGGTDDVGTVFELTPGSNGEWTEKVIHTFNENNGSSPAGGLVLDSAGNLYGVTQLGGGDKVGVAYELTSSDHGWKETILHSFTDGVDGGYPYAERLTFDHEGNLYGTTMEGGTHNLGAVFRLSPTGAGGWREELLYSFDGTVAQNPWGGVIMDHKGNLYGTCANGNGTTTVGAVFELMRNAGANWTEVNLHLFTGPDGKFPEAGVVRDAAGNLYGTTNLGGAYDEGTVYEVVP